MPPRARPPPLFKFNFSAECIESTPERHLVSLFLSRFFFLFLPRNFPLLPLYFLRRADFRSTYSIAFPPYFLSFGEEILFFFNVRLNGASKVIKETYLE